MAQLRIPLDAQRFAKGLTWKDYTAQMGDTRARTEDNYTKSVLTEDERKFCAGLTQVRYVLMLAENWCGDVHRNSPLIAHMCEAMPNCELRVFLRDKNPDLMDRYLNQGLYRSIPVFAFFDESMKEMARFIERPPAQTEEIEKKMLEVRRALRAERYPEWREGVVKEIRSLLKV